MRPVVVAADRDAEGPLGEVDARDVVRDELGAEALGLRPEAGHQLGAGDAFREPRVVLDLRGAHELTAGREALDHERAQVGPCGIDGRRVAGARTAGDDDVADVVHGGYAAASVG